MKIITREEFLKMPENTLFSTYKPCAFGELCIKGESLNNDFFVQYIKDSIDCDNSDEFVNILDDAEKNNTSIEMDFDTQGRDGCFEDGLLAIWEKEDVKKLVDRLKECLK